MLHGGAIAGSLPELCLFQRVWGLLTPLQSFLLIAAYPGPAIVTPGQALGCVRDRGSRKPALCLLQEPALVLLWSSLRSTGHGGLHSLFLPGFARPG